VHGFCHISATSLSHPKINVAAATLIVERVTGFPATLPRNLPITYIASLFYRTLNSLYIPSLLPLFRLMGNDVAMWQKWLQQSNDAEFRLPHWF
jgi:hypothetical protein